MSFLSTAAVPASCLAYLSSSTPITVWATWSSSVFLKSKWGFAVTTVLRPLTAILSDDLELLHLNKSAQEDNLGASLFSTISWLVVVNVLQWVSDLWRSLSRCFSGDWYVSVILISASLWTGLLFSVSSVDEEDFLFFPSEELTLCLGEELSLSQKLLSCVEWNTFTCTFEAFTSAAPFSELSAEPEVLFLGSSPGEFNAILSFSLHSLDELETDPDRFLCRRRLRRLCDLSLSVFSICWSAIVNAKQGTPSLCDNTITELQNKMKILLILFSFQQSCEEISPTSFET